VLLPVPSSPSKVMNLPRRDIVKMIAALVRPCTAALAGCYSLKFCQAMWNSIVEPREP